MRTLFFILLMASAIGAQSKNVFTLPAIFSDNMVFQQKTSAPVWGIADPGTKILITATWGQSANAVADDNGMWTADINTPSYGGPYEVKIAAGDTTVNLKNVLVGEVWLCSGQSNMEMPLQGWPPIDTIFTSKQEIAKADYPNLRLFTVARAFSTKPEFECSGSWSQCTPQTVAQFSATAFFFGKKLLDELNVPIGLIHSSWGGTRVEAWISSSKLDKIEKYQDEFEKMKGSQKEIDKLNNWLYNHKIINVSSRSGDDKWKNLDFGDAECSAIDFNDAEWHTMNLPKNWESGEIGNFDGVVWFRKSVEIPADWINKDLVLELGPIDDMDITYVNGKKVGAYEGAGFWQVDRIYNVPADLVKSKKLNIAVRVIDNQGGGGIWGTPEKMKLHISGSDESISLAGAWKFLPVAEYRAEKFYVFNVKGEEFFTRPKVDFEISEYTLSSLYNGMISPLVPFGIKGVIWYQGEANTNNPEEYKTLFPMLIENWREKFHEENFPFYFVQIAPYNYGPETPSQFLREAQFQTLSVPHTGMAVTMDIGNPNNIHPGDKKDVGNRLAFWALAKNYGKDIPYSGPLYKSMKVENNKAVLSFEYGDGLSVKPREGKNNFLIAGQDKVFHNADVKVEGNTLIVSSPEVANPAAVRYCWSNIEEGTLFNKFGLPSPSFRTDDWAK